MSPLRAFSTPACLPRAHNGLRRDLGKYLAEPPCAVSIDLPGAARRLQPTKKQCVWALTGSSERPLCHVL